MDQLHPEPAAAGGAAAESPRDRTGAVLALSAALVAIAGVLLAVASRRPLDLRDGQLPWWIFAVGFAVTERWVARVEVRHEAYAFGFIEVPLAIGLFHLSPAALVLAHVVGSGAAVVSRVRSPRKILFNVALFSAETATATAIFTALERHPDVTKPYAWVAAFVAISAQNVLGMLCVIAVIRWHGGRHNPRQALLFAGSSAIANTSLALTAAVLVHVTPAGIALVLGFVVVLFVAYSGYTSLSRRYASLQLLYDFTRAVGATQRAEGIFTAILEQARSVLRAGVAEIVLISGDDPERCFHVRAVEGQPLISEIVEREAAVLWTRAVVRGEVVLVSRQSKPRESRELLKRLGARDLVAAPLRHNNDPVGYLLVSDRMGELGTFDGQDARLLETLANHSSVAIENGRLVDRLAREIEARARQAATDAITGLANRAAFVEQLAQALAERPAPDQVAVVLMDLDHFKEVNDTLGHNVGDEVLCQVATRVASALPAGAAVARLGGDEFAVLLPSVHGERAVFDAVHDIRSILLPPFHVRDVALEVGASIGIALSPTHGNDPHTLLKCADIAMYAAKREPSGVEMYDKSSDEHSVERLALVSALRQAIDADELLVYFQPKVRIADEEVVGAEALVRWLHPEHGMLAPDVFIGIAERTGLIGGLTNLVARRAMQQCADWRSLGFDLSIAVNISAQSLLDAEFPATIGALLDDTGLAPEQLTVEITESTIMDPKRTMTALQGLAELGVRLSVDDFGTGYSSLTYLQRLPVHEVKVDRSFVMSMGTNESDAAIVKSIIDLGHNLGLRVVAEGVEDRVAWDRLARQGCDVAQGYYLSRPIPADAFTQWLRDWEPERVQPVAAVERAITALGAWR